MYWIDIASIVFSCTAANHLGLVDAIEEIIGKKLPIVNCCKCLSFWCVLAYSIIIGQDIITSLAISFLCAYLAVWLELIMGIVDTLYNRVYDKVFTFTAEDNKATSDADEADTESGVSDL